MYFLLKRKITDNLEIKPDYKYKYKVEEKRLEFHFWKCGEKCSAAAFFPIVPTFFKWKKGTNENMTVKEEKNKNEEQFETYFSEERIKIPETDSVKRFYA